MLIPELSSVAGQNSDGFVVGSVKQTLLALESLAETKWP